MSNTPRQWNSHDSDGITERPAYSATSSTLWSPSATHELSAETIEPGRDEDPAHLTSKHPVETIGLLSPTASPSHKFSLISWRLQLFSSAFSVFFLAGLVALLYAYGNQPSSHWPSKVFSFNSAVGAMSTGVKVTMMLAVADSISQCKWNWFAHNQRTRSHHTWSNGRSLKDLEVFDGASRGAYGSVLLIGKSRM